MKLFNLNLRPMMDEDGGGLGGPAPQGTEGASQDGVAAGGEAGAEGSQEVEGAASNATDHPNQTKQPHEVNAKMAEMRVKATAAEKRAAQVEQAYQRDLAIAKKYGKDYEVFSEADIVAKFGSTHGIKTVADFEAALQKEQQDAEYKAQGLDPDAVSKLLDNHPVIQAAKAQQGQALINSEIAELSSEYPDLKIKTLADMQALPNFEAIKEKAYKGMTLLEAYEAVNRAEIRQRAKEEGAQGAIRNIGSKAHLGTEKSGNSQQGKEVEVSAEKMRVWKAMGYTEAQARQKEAKYLKK